MLPGPPTLYHSLLAVPDKSKLATAASGRHRCGRHPGRADPPRARRTSVPDADDGLRPHRGGQRDAVASRRLVRGRRHHRGTAVRRTSRCASPTTARCWSAATASCRATSTTRSPPPKRSTPTAGCTPATSASSPTAGRLRIVGRKKDMFIVGGFNAYPAEIEGFLLEHPAVAQAAVIGVPDERMGQVGKAFIVREATRGRRRRPVTTSSLEPPANGRFQGAAVCRVPRRVAVERHRQGDEGQAALSVRTARK